jgi:hypothetical protein
MAKMGRPKINIGQGRFEDLCRLLCTQEDISLFFECSVDTIGRWCKDTYGITFAEIYKQKSSTGKVSLRRKQYEVAMTGNVGMLIWLGKQHLDQSDKREEKSDITFHQDAADKMTTEELKERARALVK